MKSIKKALRLPNFMGHACKLDFPALHEILLPTLQGASFLGPKSRLKSIFEVKKFIKCRF